MPRFVGYVEDSKPFIDVFVECSRLGVRGPATFCIDTGAYCTCLVERDAIDLRVDLKRLRRDERCATGIGGSADACYLDDVKIGFLDENDRVWTASFKEVPVIVPRKNIFRRLIDFLLALPFLRPESEEAKGISSMLGFDFLQNCRISFSGKEAYLDMQ